ncbi:prolyl oligopeptidase family serine peptidase [Nisaea acidiphila]|uniref:Prolyl oligopeptidase family serine peptidase n=1 Tax=Nisaea acidiphila TaxID=1862145 RepID=A0A9J7AS00_9PROT|nr:prolyl oligopeptidase family serine peptidase [Nisaea acidiphila]UUX49990.1 prolyl oligopeptidase family serine peptidase [Nisaea acidiphila]
MRVLTVDDILKLHSFDEFFGSQFSLSPDTSALAFSLHRGMKNAPRFGLGYFGGGARGRIGIADLSSGEIDWIEAPQDLGLSCPLFSPCGTRIAVAGCNGDFVSPFVIDASSGNVDRLTDRNLRLTIGRDPFQWLGETELACELFADEERPISLDIQYRGAEKAYRAWQTAWSGSAVTASVLGSDQAFPDYGANALLCLIDTTSGKVRDFPGAAAAPEKLKAFATRPARNSPQNRKSEDDRLPVQSKIFAEDANRGIAIHAVKEDDGTRLFKADAKSVSLLLETDTHLAEITPARDLIFPYKLEDGTDVQFRSLLPPGKRPNIAGPAIMWVYPGQAVSLERDYHSRINSPTFFTLQLLAARGYTVLIPDIPFKPDENATCDISALLASTVRTACDAARSQDLYDPSHLHVMGTSMGGWAVQTLLAETDLFRSGISMAGISNLTYQDGQFDIRQRYDDTLGEWFKTRPQMLSRNWHLPGPPWDHPEIYIRNSPLFSAHRITAPLLLFHGDLDYVPITQSEEMFSALHRLGREVEFVRYWGEDHVYESPANIRDAWQRIFAWLNKHSPVDPPDN